MVLALQVSTSGFARRAARFSPLRLLLLKTAIPATAPCVHEMDTLICKLAGAVRIENNADRNSRFRSEEHTSELQSHSDLVCRLLLEKKQQKSPQHEAMVDTRHARCCPPGATLHLPAARGAGETALCQGAGGVVHPPPRAAARAHWPS